MEGGACPRSIFRGGDRGEDGAQDRREAGKGRERRRVGRPPAEMPDGDVALEGLTAFLARFLQKLVAKGIALALDALPRRYVSREFLTL